MFLPERLKAHVQLLRPANVVTAAADVLAGCAVAGVPAAPIMGWLAISGMALYAGGVVLNDVVDRELDSHERPERPIPSGRVPAVRAGLMGAMLLALGVGAAASVSWRTGLVALAVAACVLVYDTWAKDHPVLGPLTMACCRGGSLLLGIAANPTAFAQWWNLGWIPVVYIGGVTVLSRGEVHGGLASTVRLSALLMFAGPLAMVGLGLFGSFQLKWAAIPLAMFAGAMAPRLREVIRDPSARRTRTAVRTAVLSTVLLDAALASGFAGPWYGAGVLALLGISALLARVFAVT